MSDYFTEIEAHFARRRGTPFILNAKDWALMKSWSDAGVPLPVVIEAIDSVFDKNEAAARKRAINSLSYCKHAVTELWSERRELHAGATDAAPEESPAPLLAALAAELEGSEHEIVRAFGARVRELEREQSVPRIEERLIALEQELFDALLAAGDADALREEVRRAIGGAKLDEKTRARTEEAHLRRAVREQYALPRLTLFR
ncbi:MAG: hypothetical protein JO197_10835 [Acidobacteria bacterium]|nr:hypothetical protein [Acidobacteriota bacterium]MBV9474463.1 hypothetical protein [Acidobacteriota bacterium]